MRPAPEHTSGRRLPAVRWGSVGAVAVGGFVGGVTRYGAGRAWPSSPGHLPWSILLVNTVGAFVLAVLLVLVDEILPPTTYVRPLLGTGFCGALTTFSSVAAGSDQLAAHGHPALAAGYLAASVGAGLAAAWGGLLLARLPLLARLLPSRHRRQAGQYEGAP